MGYKIEGKQQDAAIASILQTTEKALIESKGAEPSINKQATAQVSGEVYFQIED